MAERKMTPIRVPADLLKDIDNHVGPRQRSQFIIEASQREAIHECAGAWKDEDCPELPDTVDGLNEYLRKLRKDADRSESL